MVLSPPHTHVSIGTPQSSVPQLYVKPLSFDFSKDMIFSVYFEKTSASACWFAVVCRGHPGPTRRAHECTACEKQTHVPNANSTAANTECIPLHSLGRKESTIVLNTSSSFFHDFSGHPSVRFHSLFLLTDKVLSSRRPPPLNSKSWGRRTKHAQRGGSLGKIHDGDMEIL